MTTSKAGSEKELRPEAREEGAGTGAKAGAGAGVGVGGGGRGRIRGNTSWIRAVLRIMVISLEKTFVIVFTVSHSVAALTNVTLKRLSPKCLPNCEVCGISRGKCTQYTLFQNGGCLRLLFFGDFLFTGEPCFQKKYRRHSLSVLTFFNGL